MTDRFILAGHTPVPCENVLAWGVWLQTADRCVAVREHNGVRVATLFMGLDHRFGQGGAPILFETMVFGGPHDGSTERHCTWDDAEKGHQQMCGKVFT